MFGDITVIKVSLVVLNSLLLEIKMKLVTAVKNVNSVCLLTNLSNLC